jgi:zinc protease
MDGLGFSVLNSLNNFDLLPKTHRLDNGFQIHVLERRVLPITAVMLIYGVGSANESEKERGLAHFLEHMMFKGSKDYPLGAIDRFSHRSGGENNAFTTRDYTTYYHLLPSSHWEEGLRLEQDRMLRLRLDSKEFEAERQVVLEELNICLDDPQECLYDAHYKRAYTKEHPYYHPIIGFRESLEAVSLSEMQDFYERFYQPGNAQLLVVGDVDSSRVMALGSELFLEKLAPGGRPYIARVPRSVETGFMEPLFLEQDVDQVRMKLSFPSHSATDPMEIVSALCEEILAGGRTSRLYRLLREEHESVNQVVAYNDSQALSGRFFLEMELRSGVRATEVFRQVSSELKRLGREEVTEEEFSIAKARILSSHYFEQERLEDLLFSLAHWISLGQPSFYADFANSLARVTAGEVRDYMVNVLDERQQLTALCFPPGTSKQILEIAKDSGS